MGREIIEDLDAKIVDPFLIHWYIWLRLEFCLVFMLRISEFALYVSLLLTTSRRRESIYCDWIGKILSFFNKSVHLIIMFFLYPEDIYVTWRIQYLNVLNDKSVIQYNCTHFTILMLFLSTYNIFYRWQNMKFFFKCGYNWSCYNKVYV